MDGRTGTGEGNPRNPCEVWEPFDRRYAVKRTYCGRDLGGQYAQKGRDVEGVQYRGCEPPWAVNHWWKDAGEGVIEEEGGARVS